MSATNIVISVAAQTRDAVREIGGITDALQKQATNTEKAQLAIRKMAVPAAAAFAAVSAGALAATRAASDLGESTNAVNKVFRDSSAVIQQFGDQAAESIGLSKTEFQSLATSTGSMLTNMGQSTKEAADNTVILATRAADLASVFNTDVGTALEAVNAGLRGETEPLRRFGINLNDAAIKSKAMALGLYEGKGALDASAKAAAVQALVLEQSAAAAGDFADTSDGAANSQRILQAQLKDLSAEMGQVLLPYLEKVIGAFRGMVGWIRENQTLFQVLVAAIALVAGTIVTLNVALKAYEVISKAIKVANLIMGASWFAALGPIGLVIAAIAAVIAIGVLVVKNWDKISAWLKRAWESIKNVAVSVWTAIKDWFVKTWNAIKNKATELFEGLRAAVASKITAVITFAKQLPGRVVAAIGNVARTLYSKGIDIIQGFIRGYLYAYLTVARFFAGLASKVAGAIGNLGRTLYNKGRDLIQGFVNGIRSMAGAVLNAVLSVLPGPIRGALSGLLGIGARSAEARIASTGMARAGTGDSRTATINFYGAPSEADARLVKRALEGYDVQQGRPAGAPLRVAW